MESEWDEKVDPIFEAEFRRHLCRDETVSLEVLEPFVGRFTLVVTPWLVTSCMKERLMTRISEDWV